MKIYDKIVTFLKKYYRLIWLTFSSLMGVLVGYLIYAFVLLWWVHSLLIGLAAFGLLISVLPTEETDDPDEIFAGRFRRLLIVWVSVIGFLLFSGLIPLQFIILTVFLSIIVVGAISLIYMKRQEEKEK